MAEQDLKAGLEIIFVIGITLKVLGAKRLVTELYYAARTRGGYTV